MVLVAGTVTSPAESMDFIELGFTSFGVDSGSSENFEHFGMRDLAIYKGELSSSDVSAIYAGGAFKDWRTISVGSNELKHYWPLSGHADDIVNDTLVRSNFTNVEHGTTGNLIWTMI